LSKELELQLEARHEEYMKMWGYMIRLEAMQSNLGIFEAGLSLSKRQPLSKDKVAIMAAVARIILNK
jgi:hypothetical protein